MTVALFSSLKKCDSRDILPPVRLRWHGLYFCRDVETPYLVVHHGCSTLHKQLWARTLKVWAVQNQLTQKAVPIKEEELTRNMQTVEPGPQLDSMHQQCLVVWRTMMKRLLLHGWHTWRLLSAGSHVSFEECGAVELGPLGAVITGWTQKPGRWCFVTGKQSGVVKSEWVGGGLGVGVCVEASGTGR